MIPDSFINNNYEMPPCWCLVVDVYSHELGLSVTDFKTVNSSIRAIASAFRIALHKADHGFIQIDEPQDFAVVLMGKMRTRVPHHAGIYYQGNVLHATATGVIYESLESVSDSWPKIEYWAKS